MDKFTKASATKRFGNMDVTLHGDAIGDYLVHSAKQISGEKGYMVTRISTGETISGTRAVDRDLARRMAREQASGSKNPGGRHMRKNKGAQMARRNSKAKSPGYYIVDKDFVLGGATGDRLLRRTKRGVPSGSIDFGSEGRAQSELGYLRRTGRLPLFARGASVMRRNPDVRLTWTQRGHTVYDPTGHGEPYGGGAWWRTGLKKPKEVKRAVRAAHKYARKQKDWLSHRVKVENPKLRPFSSKARYSTPYYSVQGRQYDDYATARAMAEQFNKESGEPVAIMKKDDSYSPAYRLETVTARRGRSFNPRRRKGGRMARNPRRKRSYKRRNPVVRRKRRAPKRGYRKLSRAAKRRPRNAKGQFIKRKRAKRR